jgi:VWFA-related protein
MQRFGPALAFVALLGGAGHAQEPAPAPDRELPEAVFSTEVNYVEIDAFVMDDDGEFLRGLTREDFEVFEEGVPQQITSFNEIEIPIELPEATFDEEAARLRDIATNEEALGGRIYVFLLDEAHVDPRNSGTARDLATRFIDEQMGSEDIASVVFTGDRADSGQTFTTDKRLLREAVARFTGAKPPSATIQRMSLIEFQRDTAASQAREPEDAMAPVRGRDLDPADLERTYNARKSMETLKNVARELGGVHGRRKAVLYFSEGIDYDTLDVMRSVQRDASGVLRAMGDAIGVATRHNVAVCTVDPRGLISGLGPDDIQMSAAINPSAGETEQQGPGESVPATAPGGLDSMTLDREVRRSLDSLQTLASETGGIAVMNTNDFGEGYEEIVRANSHYYLLGYYPDDFRRDGKFRRIQVRVRKPGVTVVARDGYVRPREDEEERPERRADDDTSKEVRELLESPWSRTGLTLGVTAAAFKGPGRTGSVAVTIQLEGAELPFRQEGDRAVNEIEVSLLAIDQEGRVQGGDRMLVQPRLSEETLGHVQRKGMRFVKRLELPPGRYQLRVAAREKEQGKRGSVFYDVQVPDYADETLALSGVLITSRRAPFTLTAAKDERIAELLETPPTVARAFEPDDVLTAYAEVYGDPELAHDVTVTAQVTGADGSVAFRTTEESAATDLAGEHGVAQRVSVPLDRLAPGPYVLQIEAKPAFGNEVASRALSFDVLPGAVGRAAGDVGRPDDPPRSADRRGPSTRIDRLEAWLAGVEEHVPGTADGAARLVRSWAPEELAELAGDLALVARLIEDPKHPVLWVIDPTRPTRFYRAPYSTEDEARIRAAAHAAASRCGDGADPDGDGKLDEAQIRCARNRILKRGAVLHTDAAVHVEDRLAPAPERRSRPSQWRVQFADGQQRAAQGAPGHWELARSLLDNVAPEPGKVDTIRLWYIATAARGQYYERHTRHEDRAVELFPDDPHVLFLAACLHENFASPRIQSLARSIHVSDTRHGIEPAESELRSAEKLFRRSLEADPDLVEARIRLGRVLHLLGRPEQAALELRQAVTTLLAEDSQAPDATLMLYFAEMFFGATAEAQGQPERARASYARAAELYPAAPSPQLALSQLALRRDDRPAALRAVERALQPEPGLEERDDPWWQYHVVQGRDAAVWFERLHESLGDEP